MTILIEALSKLYPPGQDLIGGDEKLKEVLKKIEQAWDKKKEPLENNPLIEFKDSQDKRQQLET